MPTRDSALLRMAAVMFVLAAIVPLAITGTASLSGTLLFVAPGLAAWLVRRRSLLVALYLAQTAVYFGLTSIILREDRPPQLVAIVVMWAFGAAAGAFVVGRGAAAARTDRDWAPPRWPHFALTAGLIAVQAILILSGQLGYEAQLTLGLTTPEGLPGILATAAPVVSLMLLITALGSQRRVSGAVPAYCSGGDSLGAVRLPRHGSLFHNGDSFRRCAHLAKVLSLAPLATRDCCREHPGCRRRRRLRRRCEC